MKQGRTLSELAAELERQTKAKHDFKAPTSELQSKIVDGEFVFGVGDVGTFKPTPLFHDQLGTWAQIPSKYYDRMLTEAPDLLAENTNHWLHKKKETRLVRTMDSNARAFLSNRYRPIDNNLIAEAALSILLKQGSGLRVESCEVTEKRLYIKAVSERVEAMVKGKPVQAGICISNSEVGLHSLNVELMILILVCMNGAMLPEGGLKRYHVGRHAAEAEGSFEVFTDETRKADDKALVLKLRDVIGASFSQPRFQEVAKMLNITTGNKIEVEPMKAIERVTEVFQLPETSRGSILKALAEGQDYSQWGLSNAITLYAQDKSHDYEHATELEKVGGEILMLPPQKWNEIAVAVKDVRIPKLAAANASYLNQ